MTELVPTPVPTQVRRPWRATLRSAFQALVAFAGLAPLIALAVEEATGVDLDGVPFVVTALLVCAAVTRVMALPGVEAFLQRFVPFLSATPRAERSSGMALPRDERGSFQLMRSQPTRGASRDRSLPGKQRVRARRGIR